MLFVCKPRSRDTTSHTPRATLTSRRLWHVSRSCLTMVSVGTREGEQAAIPSRKCRWASQQNACRGISVSHQRGQRELLQGALARSIPGQSCRRHGSGQALANCFVVRPEPGTSTVHLDIQESPVCHLHRSLPSKPGSVHSRLLGSHLPLLCPKRDEQADKVHQTLGSDQRTALGRLSWAAPTIYPRIQLGCEGVLDKYWWIISWQLAIIA